MKIRSRICETSEELMGAELFQVVLRKYLDRLAGRGSFLLKIFGDEGDKIKEIQAEQVQLLLKAFDYLQNLPIALLPHILPGTESLVAHKHELFRFIEGLYNFWREYDRFIICDSEGEVLDKRPYRTFNNTIEQLTHTIRKLYRDLQENISGAHPNIYRQIRAGAEIATIALPNGVYLPACVPEHVRTVPVIRQILLNPPLILTPPMNRRTGRFVRVDRNPLEGVKLRPEEWLCFPAKVGDLFIWIYFHEVFYELGFSMCNLFEPAEKRDLRRLPDAVYFYGVPGGKLDTLAEFPTVFYDNEEEGALVAAVPNRPEFGYFGYLKKMVLTLHNIVQMRRGRFPFHGALSKIYLKGGREATILMIGDTGAGKSETLEAFRILGEEYIRDLVIIADDMGSIGLAPDGPVLGYGTEIGAFLRLDDLSPGYAFGQIDRAIIMGAGQTNARILMPVTEFSDIVAGIPIDYILYANNYDPVDDDHPVLDRFTDAEAALDVFREGRVMSKGTTTTTGIVQSYFANIFGPPQYRDLHDPLATKYFTEFIDRGVFVGQIRTQLGIPGWEREGPTVAARALLEKLIHE